MNNREFPVLVSPYSTPQPNEPLSLYDGLVTLERDGQQFTCDAQISFDWLPSPRISFSCFTKDYGEARNLATIGVDKEDKYLNVQIPGTLAPIPVSLSHITRNWGIEGTSIDLRGRCKDAIVFDAGVDLKYLLFHLVNFEDMLDDVITNGSDSWMGRATAEFDGWQLTLDTVENYSKLEKTLNEQSGYAITHLARLERTDGELFSADQAKPVLDGLFWFLSFARGFWSPPILPIGYDEQGNKVWQEWRASRATAWRGTSGWLSDRQYVSQSLQNSLRGFWAKWNDPIWNDPANNNTPLILAVHWFISANTDAGGIEGSIILA